MALHLSRRQRARIAASGKPLEGRTVAELETAAATVGVKAPRGARKTDLVDAIKGATATPAPGDNDTAGGE